MAQPHARSGEVIDLRPLGKNLPNTPSTAIVKGKGFEAIRLVIPSGKAIPAHEVAVDIMLHCLEGRVALGLSGVERELAAGDWIFLEGGARHRLMGIEDSSLLLTILFDH